MAEAPESPSNPQRVVAIDVLRGVTILLMIFVNDIAGVPGTPAWLKHFEPSTGDVERSSMQPLAHVPVPEHS